MISKTSKESNTAKEKQVMNTKPQFHGSDLETVEAYYHIPKEQIVSFGANVNPLGLSKNVKEKLAQNLDVLSSYPDRNYSELKKSISTYLGKQCENTSDAPSPECIIVGNGSTELISLLIQTKRPKKALLLGPTYSEYSRELSLIGSTLEYYCLKEENDFHLDIDDFCRTVREKSYGLVIICNPNNPTSSALTNEEIRTILETCRKTGSFLMIDETYAEFAPKISEITAMPLIKSYPELMVLRGVSKFFAAPGLRLGYGATSNIEFLEALTRMQNPWSLSSIGALAGTLMLSDNDYIQKTRALILTERTHMHNTLQTLRGIKTYPAYANFILVRLTQKGLTASDAFDHLIQKGLMIRDCSSFSQLNGEYIRFCIMNPEDNERLLKALDEYTA